jgi:hypothetical protein
VTQSLPPAPQFLFAWKEAVCRRVQDFGRREWPGNIHAAQPGLNLRRRWVVGCFDAEIGEGDYCTGIMGLTKSESSSSDFASFMFWGDDTWVVVVSVKSEDYAGALTQLQTLARNAKLTPEQQQVIKGVIE